MKYTPIGNPRIKNSVPWKTMVGSLLVSKVLNFVQLCISLINTKNTFGLALASSWPFQKAIISKWSTRNIDQLKCYNNRSPFFTKITKLFWVLCRWSAAQPLQNVRSPSIYGSFCQFFFFKSESISFSLPKRFLFEKSNYGNPKTT